MSTKKSILFLFLLSSFLLCAQKKHPAFNPLPSGWHEVTPTYNPKHTKYSLAKRLLMYPFNKATKIAVVSFSLSITREYWIEHQGFNPIDTLSQQDNKRMEFFKIPIKNNTILFNKMDAIKILTLPQIQKTTDLLYNTCARWTDYDEKVMGCYFPRNAIIFFDENDKPFEYIEICFECRAIETSSKKINHFEKCDYMFNDLEKYFNKIGIKTKSLKE